MTMRFIKDPLTHFLIVGLILYLMVSGLHSEKRDTRIAVDEQSLLTFYQYRVNAFEANAASAMLERLPRDEKHRLIEDYVRGEALYREAKKLGLDQSDHIIRRRMAQKVEFLTTAAADTPAPSDAEMMSAYERTKADYLLPARITFSHIFFSFKNTAMGEAEKKASYLLSTLNASGAGFKEAGNYGDRFLFHRNYVERSFEYVKTHFGADAANAIFLYGTEPTRWRGPIYSAHGAHLVFISDFQPSRQPAYEEVKSQVKSALVTEALSLERDAALQKLTSAYVVAVDPQLLEKGWPDYKDR